MKLVRKHAHLLAGILTLQILLFSLSGSWGEVFRSFSLLPLLVMLCALKQNWLGLGICILSGFLLDIFSFATFGSFLFKSAFLFFVAGLWLEFFSGLSLYMLFTLLVFTEVFLNRFAVFLLTWGKESLFQHFPLLTFVLNLAVGYLLIFLIMENSGPEER